MARESSLLDISEIERLYGALVEAAPDAILVAEPGARSYLLANAATERLLGYSRAELQQLSIDDLLDPAELPRLPVVQRQVEETGFWRGTWRLSRKDGTRVAVEVTYATHTVGGRALHQTEFRDVTERTQAQDEIERANRQKSALLDSTAESIFGADLLGRCTFINRSAANLLGYAPADLIGKDLHELTHHSYLNGTPYPSASCPIYHAYQHGQRIRAYDDVIWRRDGTVVAVEYSCSPIVEDGQTIGTVVTVTDLADRKSPDVRMTQLAYDDRLFGLTNRALFLERLGQALTRVPRLGETIAVLFLDLDNFKDTTDRLGDGAEDRLLEIVSERLLASVRAEDTAARLGGYEFGILLSALADVAGVSNIADRIVANVRAPITLDGHELCANVSIGIALSSPETAAGLPAAATPEAMLHHADLVMSRAKTDSRAQSPDFDAGVEDEIALEPVDPGHSMERTAAVERESTAQNRAAVMSDRLSAALESISEAVMIFDAEGHPYYLNPSFVALFGYTLDALQAGGGREALYVDEAVATEGWSAIAGGGSWHGDVKLRCRDGRVLTILLHLDRIFDDVGQLIGMVATCTDITEPRQAEQVLRENRDFLQAVIDAIADPVFVKDEQHRWVLGNTAFWELLGQPEGAVGKSDYDLFPKEEADAFWAEDERTITDGKVREHEESLTGADGRTRTILTKKSPLTLADGSRYLVAVIRDVTERKQLEGQLSHLAYYDQLSGLPNRSLYLDRLGQALARAPRLDRSVAVLFLDLDNFKVINDSLGHNVGDRLLAAVSKRLDSSVRAGDTAARFGGDEFAILLEDVGDDDVARDAADRIVMSLRSPITLDGHEICPSFSIGVTVSSPGSESAEGMLRHADLAMYRAKANGKAQYAMFDEGMAVDAMDRMTLEAELRHACDQGELRIEYQPIVDLVTGRIAELEALVRWQHPRHGLMSPARFIPVAEETGLIVPIGHWILEQACGRAQIWRTEIPDAHNLVMSVNLSARQFRHPGLVADVTRILSETGLEPSALKLEITESVMMQHMSSAIVTMAELKALGVRLAIDDFGTGYSSLAYIKEFPVDTLKIDRSFVHGLGHDHSDRAIVRSVIALARTLQLAVTAEGIETAEQLMAIQELGCDFGQGYLLARPGSDTKVGTLLNAHNSLIEVGLTPLSAGLSSADTTIDSENVAVQLVQISRDEIAH